ncbi:MAG: hypothetical protein OQK35_03205 [Alphaproteobacteria bacterium]|nr:hypothetical protein [Rhodospirillales bacterium]MCW9045319.1 hypothetical protein [Alphaproteobacteria bacterium]
MSQLDSLPPPPHHAGESLEELRSLLWKTHKVTVDEYDPVLMVYTIHQVAIKEFQQMLDHHDRVFSEAATEAAQIYADNVGQSLEGFKSDALTDAIRERLSTVRDTAEITDNAQGRLRQTVWLLWWLTALNYLGVALTLGILTVLAI